MVSEVVLQGVMKASMFKEALASYQIEGIALNLTLEDLYLAELGIYKTDKIKKEINNLELKRFNKF